MDLLDSLEDFVRQPPPTTEATSSSSLVPFGGNPGAAEHEDLEPSPVRRHPKRTESVSGSSKEKAKKCFGCRRCPITGRCFLNPSEVVKWGLPPARGNYCGDCLGAQRIYYGSTMSLTVFTSWLNSPDNLERWVLVLAAYLSLKLEGVTYFTYPLLVARVDAFTFMSNFLGLPSGNFAIVMLKELINQSDSVPWHRDHIMASRMATMRHADGSSHACVFLRDARPMPESFEMGELEDRYPAYRQIGVADAREADAVSNLFSGHQVSNSSSSGIGTLALYQSGKPTTPLDAKWWVCHNTNRAAVLVFTEVTWATDAKEVHFTRPLTNCSSLHSEARAAGNDQIVEKLKVSSSAMSAAKAFLKLHREMVRSKNVLQKMVRLSPHASEVRNFVMSFGLAPAPSFHLLCAKATFLEALDHDCGGATKGQPIADALKDAVDGRLVAVLLAHHEDEKSAGQAFNPTFWLASTIQNGIQVLFTALPEKWHPDVQKMLVIDFRNLADLLATMGREIAAHVGSRAEEVIETVCADATALSDMFSSASADSQVKPSAVKKAHDRITSKSLDECYANFLASVTGQEVLSMSAVHLRRFAKEEIGDSKLSATMNFLNDDRVPRSLLSETSPVVFTVTRKDTFQQQYAQSVLVESITNVCEAVAVWSTQRLEEQSGGLVKAADAMLGIATANDVAMNLMLYNASTHITCECELEDDPTRALAALGSCLLECRDCLSRSAREFLCDEPDTAQVQDIIGNLIECLNQKMDDAGMPFATISNEYNDIFDPNVQFRKAHRRVLEKIAELSWMTVPSTIPAALDEFKVASSRPTHRKRFLEVSLELVEMKGTAESLKLATSYLDDDVRLSFVDGLAPADTTDDMPTVSKMRRGIAGLLVKDVFIAAEQIAARTCSLLPGRSQPKVCGSA